jgi:hypothetical protein
MIKGLGSAYAMRPGSCVSSDTLRHQLQRLREDSKGKDIPDELDDHIVRRLPPGLVLVQRIRYTGRYEDVDE